jgi:hypothetical protein
MLGMGSRRLKLLLVSALPLACAEPLSPNGVAGAYALQQVAGDALPTLLYTNEYVTVRILADTLRLTADGRGTVNTVRESEPLTGGPTTGPHHAHWAFGFRVVGDRIEIAFDCPINANCAPPPHIVARTTAEGLRVDSALGARVPQIYTRLSSIP